MIRLLLPLKPFGAARTRTRAFPTGRKGKGGRPVFSVQHFMDEKYRAWRELAMPYFQQVAPEAPLEGPLAFSLLIVNPCLSATEKLKRFTPRTWHAVKPDGDNVTKAVLDCAEEAGWMLGDAQVCRTVVEKVRAAKGEKPSLSIVLKRLDGPYHLR